MWVVVLRAKASSKIGSSLKPNHHDIVKFVKISETHCSLSKFLIHIVDSQDSSETLNQNETPKKMDLSWKSRNKYLLLFF